MANVELKDGAGTQKYAKSTGAGTIGDPFVVEHLDTNSAAIKTAVELIDNAIAGNEMQVDVLTMPTVTISDGGSSITVDGTLSLAALPAGTNNIGDVDVVTLPALPAGTNNIGDVDVLSIAAGDNNIGNVDIVTLPALPSGTNNIGDVDVLTLPGTAAEAAALPGVFHVVAGDDGTDTHPLQLDASGFLKVNVSAGAAAGTEYTEGATDATITGTAALAEGPSDTLTPLQLDASGFLKVNVSAGGAAGVQYTEGDTDATITGTAILWEDAANTLVPVSAAKPLPVSASIDPTGLATSANQTTIIGHVDGIEGTLTTIDGDTGAIATSVASIDTKAPALGQALAAASVPVVLTAAQITTLTPPAAITGFGTAANQTTIIGHLDGVEGILATIDGDTGTLAAAVAGTEIQVDVVAALPAGTNNIGDVDVLTLPADPLGANADAAATAGSTGSLSAKLRLVTSQLDAIKTAVEALDNAIAGSELQVDIVAALPAGTNNIGDVDVLSLPALPAGTNDIGATKDSGPHWTSSFGVSGARVTSADATGIVSVTDAPTGGQKLVITDVLVSVDTAMRVDFLCETTGTILFTLYLPASGSAQFTPRSKLKLPTADKKLQIDSSVAGNVAVSAFYYSES